MYGLETRRLQLKSSCADHLWLHPLIQLCKPGSLRSGIPGDLVTAESWEYTRERGALNEWESPNGLYRERDTYCELWGYGNTVQSMVLYMTLWPTRQPIRVKGQTQRPTVIGSPEEGHNTHLALGSSVQLLSPSFSVSFFTQTAERPWECLLSFFFPNHPSSNSLSNYCCSNFRSKGISISAKRREPALWGSGDSV